MQQQQGSRDRVAQMQQMAGSSEFQPPEPDKAGKPEQMGEGSYEGTREYKERTERYLEKADVGADAEKAKPRSEAEEREMKEAEDEGRSHSRGEG
jgi:hypothetical protein